MFPSAHLCTLRSSFAKLAGRLSFAKLASLALLVCAASNASAQTAVHFGDTISSPGLYFLAGNQTGSGSTNGIDIESDDVFLFLGRFTLRGDGTFNGISSLGNDNVTIWGGRVTNFHIGIEMTAGSDCTVKDVRIDNCDSTGLFVNEMRDSWFLRLRCDQNGGEGVDARGCPGSRFVSILAHDNTRNGILLDVSTDLVGELGQVGLIGSKVRLCWASYNDLDGIRVQNTHYHEIVKNQCVGNLGDGIHLRTLSVPVDASALPPPPGPSNNAVTSNWCVFNLAGIVVDRGAQQNTLTNNTALANIGVDVVDDNDVPPCANIWFLNFFLTRGGDGAICIF